MRREGTVLGILQGLPSNFLDKAVEKIFLIHGHSAQIEAAREVRAVFDASGGSEAEAALALGREVEKDRKRLQPARDVFNERWRSLHERRPQRGRHR